MAKDPAFLFYPGDYLRDTQTLSEKTQVSYDRIMCEHMRNICITHQQLKFFTKRLNKDEKEELLMLLAKKDGVYIIDWVAESIIKRREYSESRRNNRIKKDTIISKTYDPHMENENGIEDINDNIVELYNGTNISFSNFWKEYKKKVGYKKCLAKWNNGNLSKEKKKLAIDYLPAYKQSKPDKNFRQNPLTYLNSETWNDEIIKEETQQDRNEKIIDKYRKQDA